MYQKYLAKSEIVRNCDLYTNTVRTNHSQQMIEPDVYE